MSSGKTNSKSNWFEDFASKATKATGSNTAFIIACSLIAGWIITGPIFHYSDTWQLVINTGTTIITFLMVFLIQKTQNKDAIAIQIKLDELVAANENASNQIVSVEDLTEDELIRLHHYYSKLSENNPDEKIEKKVSSKKDIEIAMDVKNRIAKKMGTIKKNQTKK